MANVGVIQNSGNQVRLWRDLSGNARRNISGAHAIEMISCGEIARPPAADRSMKHVMS